MIRDWFDRQSEERQAKLLLGLLGLLVLIGACVGEPALVMR